jgi:predicted nucleic acid-binding protein
MAKVFWDTNLFIYLLEENPVFCDQVTQLRARMLTRGDRLYTSTLTVGEILAKPPAGDRTAQRYLDLFRSPAITVTPFDFHAAAIYSRLRRDRALRPPDAIQLACAAAAAANLFITNDTRLSHRLVPGIDFIVSLARVPI